MFFQCHVVVAFVIVVPWIILSKEKEQRESDRLALIKIGQEKNKAEWQAYISSISGARIAAEEGNINSLESCLLRAPAKFREWEWPHYVHTWPEHLWILYMYKWKPVQHLCWELSWYNKGVCIYKGMSPTGQGERGKGG